MEKARKELFIKICDTLAAVSGGGYSIGFSNGFDTQRTGLIEWIDLWKKQEPRSTEAYPYNYPAAFVQIGKINWKDMTFNYKEGRVSFSVTLFFEKLGDTFHGASDREVSLHILDTLDACEEALQWMHGDAIKEVSLMSQEDLTDQYDRPAYRITYETMIYERYKKDNYVLNAS